MKKLINLAVLILFFQNTYGQRIDSLETEYNIINEIFNPGEIIPLPPGKVKVFSTTSDIKFWVKILERKENLYFGSNCEELTKFIEENLSNIGYKLNDLKMVELDQSRLIPRVELQKNMDSSMKKITFPLIVKDYAFVLKFDESYQLLYFLKNEPERGWRVVCHLNLYQSSLK